MMRILSSMFSLNSNISIVSYDSDEDDNVVNSSANFDHEFIEQKYKRICSNILDAAKIQIFLYCKCAYAVCLRDKPSLKDNQKEWEKIFAIIESEVTKVFEEIHRNSESILMGYYVEAGFPEWAFKIVTKKEPIFFSDRIEYLSSQDYLARLCEVADKRFKNLAKLPYTIYKIQETFSDYEIFEKFPSDLRAFIISRMVVCNSKASQIVKNE